MFFHDLESAVEERFAAAPRRCNDPSNPVRLPHFTRSVPIPAAQRLADGARRQE